MNDPTSSNARARAALKQGKFADCERLAADVLATNSADAEASFLMAMSLAERGRIKASVAYAQQAVRRAPEIAEYNAHLARLLVLLREEAQAASAARKAADTVSLSDALTLDTIGCVYARLGDHEAAAPLFEKAVAANPTNVNFRFNLVSTYGFLGRSGACEREYEEILKRKPDHGKSHLGLAGVRRQTAEANHTSRLESALRTTKDPIDRLRIHYAAAKEYEDLGDHGAVFQHLETANKAHNKRLGFTIDKDFANADALKSCFDDDDYFQPARPESATPIFVTGLPRTGTTLVERILSSHQDVSAAGELQSMPLAIKRAAQTPSRLILDVETIRGVGDKAPSDVGELYLRHARQHKGADGAVFTDKLPLNFLYIGHICRALPDAKIVCLRRHPMDSVWSNYKNLFATTSSYYAYSYDLMNTARFYVMFDGLMSYWKERFPGRVLEVGYEALVQDQEGETRRMLTHCGLEWDEACLSFHKNEESVATPSAFQVRRPVHKKSVARWRNYEAQLKEVTAYFADEGVAID